MDSPAVPTTMTLTWTCGSCGWTNYTIFLDMAISTLIYGKCRNDICGREITYERTAGVKDYKERNGL